MCWCKSPQIIGVMKTVSLTGIHCSEVYILFNSKIGIHFIAHNHMCKPQAYTYTAYAHHKSQVFLVAIYKQQPKEIISPVAS